MKQRNRTGEPLTPAEAAAEEELAQLALAAGEAAGEPAREG